MARRTVVSQGLSRLVDALEPGATPVSLRRLKGGLGARMHVLRYATPAGARRSTTLRRAMPGWDEGSPQRTRDAFNVLLLLQKAGVAAPRPLLLDAEGEYLGVPAMVLSYIPGRSFSTAMRAPGSTAWRGLCQRFTASQHIASICQRCRS